MSRLTDATRAATAAFKAVYAAADGSLTTAIPAALSAGRLAYAETGLSYALAGASSALAKLADDDPIASPAMRLVATVMADIPLVPADERGTALEQSDGAAEHPAARLLRAGLRTDTGDTGAAAFFLLATRFLYTAGIFYIDLMDAADTGPNRGKPRTLTLVPPSRFRHADRNPQDRSQIVRYHFSDAEGRAYSRTPDQVLVVRIPHPDDPLRGSPLLAGGRRALQRIAEEDRRALRASRNGGQDIPSIFQLEGGSDMVQALEVVGPDGKTRMETVRDDFQHQYAEAGSQGRPILLGPSVRPAQMPKTALPAQASQDYERSMRLVATVCGVPATLLGDQKAGSLTDAGVDSEMKVLVTLTVLPLLRGVILSTLSPVLLRHFGATVIPDETQIPALQEDADALAARVVSLVNAKIISTTTARTDLNYTDADAPETSGADALPAPPDVPGLPPAPERLGLPAIGESSAPADPAKSLRDAGLGWLLEEPAEA